MLKTMIRGAVVGMISLVLPCIAGGAQTRPEIAFSVQSLPLFKALNIWARQAKCQLIWPSGDPAEERMSTPLLGTYAPEQALVKLLDGSGLEFQFLDSDTVEIRRPAGAKATIDSMQLAQAARTQQTNETMPGERSPAGDANDQAGIPEILVRGQGMRSMNTDIRRTRDDPMPYVVFEADDIEKSNATNLEDFFRTRLPMNAQLESNSQLQTIDASNISQIDLRGLGVNQTLILIDGRRAPRSVTQGNDFVQADINGIPLSAIERIEILPSTAGGIYGGGAVGGVINIIRKRDYAGLDLRTQYGGTFRGGAEEFRFDTHGGFGLENGKTQISFSASHSDAQPFYVGDNDLWRRPRELLAAQTTAPIFFGSTPNMGTTSGALLVLDNGTPLNSNHTFVPVGYAGVASDGGAALIANVGQYNLELSNDVNGRYQTLLNNPRVRSADFNIRRTFGTRLDAFLDVSASDNEGRANVLGSTAAPFVTLQASAPNNPFRQAVRVLYPAMGFETEVASHSNVLGATAGIIAQLRGSWVAGAEYGWSRSRFRSSYESFAVTAPGRTALGNGSVDIVRDLNLYPIDWSQLTTPRTEVRRGPFDNIQDTVSARASGAVADLPGGSLNLAVAAEHRREKADSVLFMVDSRFFSYYPQRSQSNDSVYAELNLPLVSARNALPLIQSLELRTSVRHDQYVTRVASPEQVTLTTPNDPLPEFSNNKTQVHSNDYTAAFRWAFTRDITLRGSYATGFLPPSISQLVPAPQPGGIGSYNDPLRGNELLGASVPNTAVAGGNPGLQPEESKSLSFGLVLTPHFLEGLRLSADYTRIRKRYEITIPDVSAMLANDALYPGRVVRGPNLAGDPVGYAGPVIFLDYSFINISRSRMEAWDFQGDYDFETATLGNFHVYGVATLQDELVRQILPTDAPVNYVGFRNGPLRWRGNLGVDWSLRGWNIAWNAQYYGHYGANSFRDSTFGTTVDSQVYHDLNLRYAFKESSSRLLSGLSLSAGIQNVFDSEPPIVFTSTPVYSAYGDQRLRRFTLSLMKRFE